MVYEKDELRVKAFENAIKNNPFNNDKSPEVCGAYHQGNEDGYISGYMEAIEEMSDELNDLLRGIKFKY